MMRLPAVTRGERFSHRALFGVIRLMSGHRAPDVVRTLKFREEYFGSKMMFHEVMRGPSPWTVGERELFAAYVSKQNACEF
ncbi:MAG: hypothetical protein QOD65_2990 [Gaiellales bacterium]|jgi:hypothetical protein|nr:hypothetical protein [Gaiellales bacterium]MDX6598801.1 hypothetical protein [Gaiellales bacterium]